jgi:ankyrin repeat protein
MKAAAQMLHLDPPPTPDRHTASLVFSPARRPPAQLRGPSPKADPNVSPAWLSMAQGCCNLNAEALPTSGTARSGNKPGKRLRSSCLEGSSGDVRELLQAGADPDARAGDGCSAVHLAACMGHRECLRHLLNAGCQVDSTSDLGHTALICAAMNGHVDCCQLLLDTRAHPLRQDKQGSTALHRAALWSHRDVVMLLLQAGAGQSAKNGDGRAPRQMTSNPDISRMIRSADHNNHNLGAANWALNDGPPLAVSIGGGLLGSKPRQKPCSRGSGVGEPFFYVRGAQPGTPG